MRWKEPVPKAGDRRATVRFAWLKTPMVIRDDCGRVTETGDYVWLERYIEVEAWDSLARVWKLHIRAPLTNPESVAA